MGFAKPIEQIFIKLSRYIYVSKRYYTRKKDMENERKAKNYETDIEEVNVYIADCGITRKACVTDCIGGSAWISTMN